MQPGKGKLTAIGTNLKTNEEWECFTFGYVRAEHWNWDSINIGQSGLPKQRDVDLCRDKMGNFKEWVSILYPKIANALPFDADYKEITIEELNSPTDLKELVYNGRVGDAIRFVYREFKNSYARPAFTQEVQYDLSQSDEIGFQDQRMKVIDATNTDITYVVLRNF